MDEQWEKETGMECERKMKGKRQEKEPGMEYEGKMQDEQREKEGRVR